MKKSSIRRRILSRFIAVCLISMIASSILSYVTLRNVGEMTTKNATADLENQMFEGLLGYVSTKAEIMNRELNNMNAGFRMLLSEFESICATAENRYHAPVISYEQMPPGQYGLYAFAPQGKTYEEFRSTAERLAGAENTIKTVMRYYPQFTGCGIATLDGFALLYDSTANLMTAGFDFTGRDWFIGAIATEEAERAWFYDNPGIVPSYADLVITAYATDVYQNLDVGGNIMTISCAVRDGDKVVGVCYADIDVDYFATGLLTMTADGQGQPALLTPNIPIVAPELIQSESILTNLREEVYSVPIDTEAVTFDEIGNPLTIGGGKGRIKVAISGEDYYVIWDTVAITALVVEGGWKVVYLVPESVVSDPVADSAAKTERYVESSEYVSLAVQIFVLIAAMMSASVLARRLSAPIRKLTHEAVAISGGDLERVISINGDNKYVPSEVETLGNALNKMIIDIKTIAGEKERIGAELSVATNIQASMLPHIFPPFPHKTEIDLFGTMEPAKEVGGDFYDFFLADDNTLVTVIADVSGKGVPAALFMVIAKTLIKNNAQTGMSPKQVFEAVNNVLCDGNEAGMFVTAFIAYLDLRTGKLDYVNAGHNPPMLCKNGVFEYLEVNADLFLACMEDVEYRQSEMTLGSGDILYLYTDGVTEAVNREDDLFEEDRLKIAADRNASGDLTELLKGIRKEIELFADGAEQADDITMLAVKYNGGNAHA